MRHAEADRFRDGWMRKEHLVDLARRDLLAAAIDHLLEAADEREVTIVVEKTLVAGPEPSIRERGRIGLGVVLVTAHDVQSLNTDLAALSTSEMVTGFVEDRDAHARPRTDRTRFTRGWRQRVRRHLMRRLGHAVRLEHRRPKRGFEIGHD